MPKPLIADHGLYTNLAARLGRETPVAYFSTWANAAPFSRDVLPGTGLEGVERVDDPVAFILDGKASALIVPDLYLTDYERLARGMEIPTFGPGGGARIETDRWFLKEFLEAHKFPVIQSDEIAGIGHFRDYLKAPANDDKFIKLSTFRGDMETRHHRHWRGSRAWFEHQAGQLGPGGDLMRFIAERPIPSEIETGIDTYFRDGWVLPMIVGYEIKDAGYIGVRAEDWKELPREVRRLAGALAEYFNEQSYNGFFSNEMRVLKDGTVYMTDATCRVPSPPGGVMMAACRNFAAMVLKDKAPDYGEARYFCEIILKSGWVANHFLEISYPPEMEERLAFHNHCKIGEATWAIPHRWGHQEFGSACGWGETLEEAAGMAQETAEAVEAEQLTFDADVLEKAQKQLSKGAKLGFPS